MLAARATNILKRDNEFYIMTNITINTFIYIFLLINSSLVYAQTNSSWHDYGQKLEAINKDKSGIFILEKGEDALVSRAWLVDNAKKTIDVQYFIWSTDNIGTLAAAALLRAANRGIYVRVIVDDLLIDADNEVLYALANHKNIDIKIYNPNINIGTSFIGKTYNVLANFRKINQRMHNKVIIVDEQAVITGGRNMADEYYDFDHKYNFRDRDVLMLGQAVASANISFNRYWKSKYVAPIEELISNPFANEIQTYETDIWDDENSKDESSIHLELKNITHNKSTVVYKYLEYYENKESNFDQNMRIKIENINDEFTRIIDQMHWVKAEFISDEPGKNNKSFTLSGGSKITSELASEIDSAEKSITIQSPYLVMSWDAWKLLRNAVKRGVNVRIVTNSLSSTDNLAAYSGYARQRNRLLNTGFEIYEFKPDAKIRTDIINRYQEINGKHPIFALHAKSMVIDSKKSYIGSFNFDPRSENLNTEAGVFINDSKLSIELEKTIEEDMLPENSWNVKLDGHSHKTSIYKRTKVFLLKLVPMDAIL